jgi:excisionase family DNA binding protein
MEGFLMLTHDTERWLSVEEIAAHLGISKETIYRWVEREKIPAHRVGRLWKFKASEVDTWIIAGGASTLKEQQGSNSHA